MRRSDSGEGWVGDGAVVPDIAAVLRPEEADVLRLLRSRDATPRVDPVFADRLRTELVEQARDDHRTRPSRFMARPVLRWPHMAELATAVVLVLTLGAGFLAVHLAEPPSEEIASLAAAPFAATAVWPAAECGGAGSTATLGRSPTAGQLPKLAAGHVTYPKSDSPSRFVTIDTGSRDGIHINMVVVDPHCAYVGRVTEIAERESRVTLAVDTTQRIDARLPGTGLDGIISGAWQSGGQLTLHDLRSSDSSGGPAVAPQKGEVVRTAGQASDGGWVPAGLLIGHVSGEPIMDERTGQRVVSVQPAATLDHLQTVFVIRDDEH